LNSLNSEIQTFSSNDPWQFFSAEKYQETSQMFINVSIPSKTPYKKQLKVKYTINNLDHVLFNSYQLFSSALRIIKLIQIIGIIFAFIIFVVSLIVYIICKRNSKQTENNSIHQVESLDPDILESFNSEYIPPVESLNPDFIPPVSSYEPEVDSPITYDRL